MKWECKNLLIGTDGGDLNGEKLDAIMNQLGQQGWELVSVFPASMCMGVTSYIVATFKQSVHTGSVGN